MGRLDWYLFLATLLAAAIFLLLGWFHSCDERYGVSCEQDYATHFSN